MVNLSCIMDVLRNKQDRQGRTVHGPHDADEEHISTGKVGEILVDITTKLEAARLAKESWSTPW